MELLKQSALLRWVSAFAEGAQESWSAGLIAQTDRRHERLQRLARRSIPDRLPKGL